jgi:hypothetical protein
MESTAEFPRELEDACENVRRQIDILDRSKYSRGGGFGGDHLALKQLNDTLARLEEALSDLKGD